MIAYIGARFLIIFEWGVGKNIYKKQKTGGSATDPREQRPLVLLFSVLPLFSVFFRERSKMLEFSVELSPLYINDCRSLILG